MALLILIFKSILEVVLPMLLKQREYTAADSRTDGELAKRLRGRIHASWPSAALLGALACLLGGCVPTHTVYVPDGTPVRVREDIKGAKVWVPDGKGNPIPSSMTIPAGWYALPLSPENASENPSH